MANSSIVIKLALFLLFMVIFEAKAISKTDCQNQVKETVGKFIEDCQKQYNDKCVRLLFF